MTVVGQRTEMTVRAQKAHSEWNALRSQRIVVTRRTVRTQEGCMECVMEPFLKTLGLLFAIVILLVLGYVNDYLAEREMRKK